MADIKLQRLEIYWKISLDQTLGICKKKKKKKNTNCKGLKTGTENQSAYRNTSTELTTVLPSWAGMRQPICTAVTTRSIV
jgi:hypothetical protein